MAGRIDKKVDKIVEAARKKAFRARAQKRLNKLDTAERKDLRAGATHRRAERKLTVKRRADRAKVRDAGGKITPSRRKPR